jgi:hypothetical protein
MLVPMYAEQHEIDVGLVGAGNDLPEVQTSNYGNFGFDPADLASFSRSWHAHQPHNPKRWQALINDVDRLEMRDVQPRAQ